MTTYEKEREKYRPDHIKVLMIAESPAPSNPDAPGSRHFYRTDKVRSEDRLFTNTMRALYSDLEEVPEADIQAEKDKWLRRFQSDGWYMIEALEKSLEHKVTKPERQELIRKHLPQLIKRVGELAGSNTKIILIKSNVFEVAAEPLRAAGFDVLNTKLLDYPGRFNQRDYREKLSGMAQGI